MSLLNDENLYRLALVSMHGVGPKTAKQILEHWQSAQLFFREPAESKVIIGEAFYQSLNSLTTAQALHKAERQLKLMERAGVQMHCYCDTSYPHRLRHCEDGPFILFQKGPLDLNPNRALAVVGTRRSTDYGERHTEKIVEDLRTYNPYIVSGLAFGIDAAAHRAALKNGLKTLAVLAHGLDQVYPALHRKLAQEILDAGGALISEFPFGSIPDRENFPKRNRIIAGLTDATLVVEAALKGGALITADLANQYNREVFALPGPIDAEFSLGCNVLIKSHKAHLYSQPQDFEYVLAWLPVNAAAQQMPLFPDLAPVEQNLVSLLAKDSKAKSVEWLSVNSGLGLPELLSKLLQLELKGLIKALPGKQYRML